MTDIDFADDLALLADNIADAEKLLHHIEAAAREVGLYINAKKTEVMSQTETGILKSLDDQVIKQVVVFVYLGSHPHERILTLL